MSATTAGPDAAAAGTSPSAALPVGLEHFHRNRFIDYQFQRLWSEGFTRLDELQAAAAAVDDPADAPRALLAAADLAQAQGRLRHAAFYVRGAEFFTPPSSERKRPTYDRFVELFDRGFAETGYERVLVPYAGSHLPALRMRAHDRARGTVLLFGGFDSLIEEFFGVWAGLAYAGFDIVAFEGPGQGGARMVHGLTFEHDWERPVAAILDHFALRDAALVGMSMGGYWAMRAASREPRIRSVVAWPPVYDWLTPVPRVLHPVVRWMVRRRRFMRWSIRLRMRLAKILRHVVSQALWIQGSDDLADVAPWFLGMNAAHLGSAQVRQDVLLMVGEQDTFQPPRLARAQADALVHARSVTTRVFTEAEHGQRHCQMGNLGLATTVLAGWLRRTMNDEGDAIEAAPPSW